jgi:hypothetical protein
MSGPPQLNNGQSKKHAAGTGTAISGPPAHDRRVEPAAEGTPTAERPRLGECGGHFRAPA